MNSVLDNKLPLPFIYLGLARACIEISVVVQPIQIISKCYLHLSCSIRVNFSLGKFSGGMQNQISRFNFRLQNRYRLLTILGKFEQFIIQPLLIILQRSHFAF